LRRGIASLRLQRRIYAGPSCFGHSNFFLTFEFVSDFELRIFS
jgi:hypothetical protein